MMDDLRNTGTLRGFVRGRRLRLAALAATNVVAGFVEAAFLVVITTVAFSVTEGSRDGVDLLGQSMPASAALLGAGSLVALRLAIGVASSWQASGLSSTVAADIRLELTRAYVGANYSAQHGEQVGRLQELLTGFADRGSVLTSSLAHAVASACTLGALIIGAALVDPSGSLVVIMLVGTLGLLLRPLRSAVRRQARRRAQVGMEFATTLGEISQVGLEMHVFAVQDQIANTAEHHVGRVRTVARRLAFLSGLVPIAYVCLGYLAVTVALAAVTRVDGLELSTIGAAMLVLIRALSYAQALQGSIVTVSSNRPFLVVLDDEIERLRSAPIPSGDLPVGRLGPMEFVGVDFEYTRGVRVLHNVDCRLEQNEIIGVVGPSGSGKSTFVQLLLGVRSPTKGSVLAGGRPVDSFSRAEWARAVTFVPQQPRLIAGTIADNIRFYRPDVSMEEVERASRLANLHDDVLGFADGYERSVGEQGSHLSGGQQQRLVIARALVERPQLLILDEPTSSLDVRSEHLIRETLDSLRSEMTIVVIAHRLSTLDICDRIMVIQDGELKAFDTPTRLEQTSSFYREALELSGLK